MKNFIPETNMTVVKLCLFDYIKLKREHPSPPPLYIALSDWCGLEIHLFHPAKGSLNIKLENVGVLYIYGLNTNRIHIPSTLGS